MTQGTTPTLLFKFSVDLALLKEWRIIFYQDKTNNFVKTQEDCIVDKNKVIYIKLTQAETLAFDTHKYLKIQAKALTNDNNVIPSDTITTHIHEILDKALFEIENTPPTIIDTSVIEFDFNKEHCQYAFDFEDLYIEKVAGAGSDITVDKELSLTSTNPVQNKVITAKLQEIQNQLKDGVSIKSVVQTTTSTEDNGINVITVTLTDGTKSTFEVHNGSKGSQGEKGADGKDYILTEADKQEIVQQTIDDLPIENIITESDNPVSSKAVYNQLLILVTAYEQRFSNIETDIEEIDTTVKYVTFTNGETITVANNTIYTASETISNLTIVYPTGNFICDFIFTLADSGNITITLPESRYIGETPTFANGETWELSIRNGIIASGKVVSE